MSRSPYGPKPAQFGGLSDDIVMNTLSTERIKLMGTYLAIIISVLACFFFATKVVLYMITIMWIVGALSVRMLRGDREEMANTIQNYSLGYCLILIMIKIMISLVIGTPMSEWSRSLGVALPASASGTLSGYLPMMFLIMTSVTSCSSAFMQSLINYTGTSYISSDEAIRQADEADSKRKAG